MTTGTLLTIARPYAVAAFEAALEAKDLVAWEKVLRDAALVTDNKDMQFLLSDPEVTQNELLEIFFELLGKELDDPKKNFFRLLAENKRLSALPDVANLFAEYRQQHEKKITVQVISAIELSEEMRQKFAKALEKRLRREVLLDCEVDKSILGGAIIRAGDKVIDGSVRGKLNRMIEFI